VKTGYLVLKLGVSGGLDWIRLKVFKKREFVVMQIQKSVNMEIKLDKEDTQYL